jgi:hypothetical protein
LTYTVGLALANSTIWIIFAVNTLAPGVTTVGANSLQERVLDKRMNLLAPVTKLFSNKDISAHTEEETTPEMLIEKAVPRAVQVRAGTQPRASRILHTGPPPKNKGKYFAKYTCIGIVDVAPHDVWNLIGEPCKTWSSWLTSVSAVQEVDNSRRHLSPSECEYDIIQTSLMSLCGHKMTVDMHLAINSDINSREVAFKSNKSNKLLSKLEGRFKVLPLHDGAVLRDACSHVNQQELESFIQSHCVDSIARDGASIVVLEQLVQPFMIPPPPLGGLLKNHLGRHFENMISDLQLGALNMVPTSPCPPLIESSKYLL